MSFIIMSSWDMALPSHVVAVVPFVLVAMVEVGKGRRMRRCDEAMRAEQGRETRRIGFAARAGAAVVTNLRNSESADSGPLICRFRARTPGICRFRIPQIARH